MASGVCSTDRAWVTGLVSIGCAGVDAANVIRIGSTGVRSTYGLPSSERRRRCARGATHRTSDGATVLNVYSGHSPVSIQEATSLDRLRLRQCVGLLRQAGEPPIDALLLFRRKEMRVQRSAAFAFAGSVLIDL